VNHQSTFSPQSATRTLVSLAAVLLATVPACGEEPLWGEIASTLGKGFTNVTTIGTHADYKPYLHHGGPVELAISRSEIAAVVEYGLRPDLDLRVRVPYFSETLEERFGGESLEHSMSGLGEVELGAKWRFRQAISDRRKDELAVIGDVKLPTGDSKMRDRNGALITPHLQPNSGNWGAALGIAANRHTPRGGYWTSARVRAETASSRVHRGTMLELHGSAGWRLRPLKKVNQTDWMGIVGLHYHRMGKDKEFGQTLDDSGGSIWSAELSLLASKRTLGARLGVLIPLKTDLGASHAPPRYELQASLRASF
jgi:hypothetical protein